MQMGSTRFAFILPVIAVLIWSLNIVVTRYVVDFISPLSISFYRWLLAFIVLTPFMVVPVWRHRTQLLQLWPKLALLSAFGMVLYQGLAYTAAHYTTATNMGLINAFTPVFTIVIAIFILKEFPSPLTIMGCGISFAGLVLVITQGQFARLIDFGQYSGDLLMVLAVFLYAFYGVFLKKWQISLPVMVSLYIQILFALFYHLPFVYWQGLDALNADNIGSVLYAGIFPSIFATLFWMMAVQRLGPNSTSIFMNFMPIFTAVIAYFWLAEQWGIYHTVGTVLTIFGVFLAQNNRFWQKEA